MAVTKHGAHQTPEYEAWSAMRQRCLNPRCRSYKDYGARGIRIDPRWDEFVNFLADMGSRPTPRHSIDRIDNDGHYEPGNCRWTDWTTQMRNRRNTRLVTYEGRTQSVADWTEELGLTRGVLDERLRHGWAIERALFAPTQKTIRLSDADVREIKQAVANGASLRAIGRSYGVCHARIKAII